MNTSAPPGLTLRNVTKAFPGVLANDRVSVTLAPGTVHCLLGENGAGKSTLISMLAGMQQPDSGSIEIDGAVAHLRSPRAAIDAGIGVVQQHSTLIPAFTVLENLMLGDRGLRLRRAQAIARLEELSQLLGTPLKPETRISELGLGQQQQLEIAKALWQGGRFLILDEPTSMLTPQAVAELAVTLRRLTAQGLAVLLVTHKLGEALGMGDCITVLRSGRVVDHLSAAELSAPGGTDPTPRILASMFGADAPVGPAAATRTSHVPVTSGPALLELREVTTTGGGDSEVAAVSLTLRAGEILGVAGIDGQGQVALAEAIAGQRKVQHGSVHCDGADITEHDVRARRRLGVRYVTDDRLHEGIVGNLSVALNLLLGRIGERPFWRFGRIDRHAVTVHAEERIRAFGIRPTTPQISAGKLSGGNIQKLLLARELDEGARCLVVHKPSTGLDVHTVAAVHAALRSFVADGGAVLLISTDLEEILSLSHRVAVLADGRLVAQFDAAATITVQQLGEHLAAARVAGWR